MLCRFQGQIDNLFVRLTFLKLDETIGHLFDAPQSLVHHFKAIFELKLELLSRNAQILF